MSDTIQALNEVVFKAGERGDKRTADHAHECETKLYDLLTDISVIAGDALEVHVKAADRAKPRKTRVYKEIVEKIAVYFCDQCDTAEGSYHTEEAIRELLVSYNIKTVDYTGRTVKIV